VEEMRAEKAAKFRELKDKKGTREYDEWFLSYRPGNSSGKNNRKNSTNKKRVKKNKTKKNKNFLFYQVK
jgi:hypothetical protein